MLHVFPKEEFQREYNILQSLIPEGFIPILKAFGVKVAGGAMTSLFSNRDVNDIDLYFPNWGGMEAFLAYMMDPGLRRGAYDLTKGTNGWGPVKRSFKYFREIDLPGSFNSYTNALAMPETKPGKKLSTRDLLNLSEEISAYPDLLYQLIQSNPEVKKSSMFIENVGMTDKSVMFTNKICPVMQCICFGVFESTQEIFDKFDYTINMGAFNFATDQWEFDKNFMKHIAQKVLVVNPGTDYPLISMLRSDKYRARGYTISRRETMKLGLAASRLEISSWEDAKSHLSGMYGTNVEELFDENRDFSFELLFDKLDRAGDKIISSIATEKEKGEKSQYNLSPVEYFPMLQRLRRSTGREHYTTMLAVCQAENFFLMQKNKPKHKFGLLETHTAKSMIGSVDFYIDKEEAMNVFNDRATNGRRDLYGNRSAPGAVLLSVTIDDPTKMTYRDAHIDFVDPENVKLTINELIDSNGEVS